jgi:hypothetical protein
MSLKGLDEMGNMGLHFLHRARGGGGGWPSLKGLSTQIINAWK